MYILASKAGNLPIISLQTSDTVGWTKQPVIDSGHLRLLAFHCHGLSSNPNLVLLARDIRQLAADCIIVDSEDELTDRDDLIRLRDALAASYSPLRQRVVSDLGRRLGSVEDFGLGIESLRVEKLFVRQSLFRSWTGNHLTIDRTQILDITPEQIVVRDTTLKAPALQADPIPRSTP
jgi:sporulation protein YlmC with PRC-barrel domain